MKKKKLKILIHPNTTHWLDFYYLGKKLSKDHNVYFIIWNEDLLKLYNKHKNKFKIIIYKNQIFWKISKYIDHFKDRSFLNKIILNLKDYFFINKLLKNKFDILIANSDRDTSILLNLCYQAKKNNIPVILNCNFRSVDSKSLIYRRINIKKYNLRKFSLIVKLFKKQYKNYKNKFISFFDEVDMILFFFLNILPKHPWVIGGGNSNLIFIENENIKKLYIKSGCKKEKLICTGSTNTDNFLHDNKNSIIYKYLNISKNSKVIILLFSQFFEHGDLSLKEQNERDNKLCRFVHDLSKKNKLKVIVSLHPKQKYQNYKWVEKDYKFKISRKRLSKIINIANLIISEAPSSIADWANILKIPYVVISKESNLTGDKKIMKYYHIKSYKKAHEKINYLLRQKKTAPINKDSKTKSLDVKASIIENYLI